MVFIRVLVIDIAIDGVDCHGLIDFITGTCHVMSECKFTCQQVHGFIQPFSKIKHWKDAGRL